MAHLGGLAGIQPFRQQVEGVDEAQQVVHIALDAACHARVLHVPTQTTG